MRIFALGDPHLSFGRPKPMDLFGAHWTDHPEQIAAGWDRRVGAEDVVLVPGDISWAHSIEEARPDLEFLAARTGRLKVLLKGNHDSWWSSIARVRAALPPTLAALDKDALRLPEGIVLLGARGWNLPGLPWADPEKDPPLYRRELGRLDLSLAAARRIAQPGDALLALLHYPPLGPEGGTSEVLDRLARAGVALAVYGHLHAEDHRWAPRGNHQGVELRLVSCDAIGFAPRLVWEGGRGAVEEGRLD